MPDALTRPTGDLRSSRRSAKPSRREALPKRAVRGTGRFLVGQLFARPATTIAGAACAALMVGIVLNALVLQNTRHPAPLFSDAPPKADTPPSHERLAVAAVPALDPTPLVASAPAQAAHAAEPPVEAAKDPIAQVLKTGGAVHTAEAPHKPAAKGKDSIGQFLRLGDAGKPADGKRRVGTGGHSTDPIARLLKTASVPDSDKSVRR